MIREFGGINLVSSDIRKAVRFYRDILKIPVLGADYLGSPDAGASENPDLMDGIELGFIKNAPHLWIWDEKKWGRVCKGNVNLVFNTEDLNELYNYLKEQGVDCDPPVIMEWSGSELRVTDPDGNVLTIL